MWIWETQKLKLTQKLTYADIFEAEIDIWEGVMLTG